MDLCCVSENSFYVIKFVNTQLKKDGNKENKENIIAALVSRLQIYVEQINSLLEQSSLQHDLTIPCGIKEVKVLHTQINFFMQKCCQLQREIVYIQHATRAYISNLEHLELNFDKLQVAKYGMQESDRWHRIIAELDELLGQNDIVELKDKFLALKKSLLAQSKMPGQAERDLQFEYLTNRIEALANPIVVHCIQTADTDCLMQHVELYKTIRRVSHLRQCYRSVHTNILLDKWKNITKPGDGINFLSDFYEILLHFVENQHKLCKQTFADVLELVDIVSETLSAIQISRQTFTMNLLKTTSDKLDLLVRVAENNANFLSRIEKVLKDQIIPTDKRERLSVGIFSYFDTFVDLYSGIEETYVDGMMKSIDVSDTNLADNIRNLNFHSTRIVKWIDDALERCIVITRGKSIYDIAKIIENALMAYNEKMSIIQMRITLQKLPEQTDWNLLQININLLEHLGDLLITVQRCDSNIHFIINTNSDSYFDAIGASRKSDKDCERKSKFTIKNHESASVTLFSNQYISLKNVAIEIYNNIVLMIVSPIEKQILQMNFLLDKQFQGFNLPDYSVAPQEYITRVGQHLLTLPQHLEPLLLTPSASLKYFLKDFNSTYESGDTCADVLLSIVVERTCIIYVKIIDDILSLSASGAKQLAIDIEYFGHVLEELSLQLNIEMIQIITLLRIPPEQYKTASSVSNNIRLVTSIRQKRNIVTC
ncbi:conserved oligomeric Golgi complex subunit 7 [Topomyia yanbarensis]|uniref:conserved oligomeric Golgi complex subunit 7 n=1 Tax=Topomyia yanbarensis TaxID=2498891 RepID=UPI00273C8B96|nr:conserved oligomeric Golgi complex subunit 7 [Topomyia yanbarensis]